MRNPGSATWLSKIELKFLNQLNVQILHQKKSLCTVFCVMEWPIFQLGNNVEEHCQLLGQKNIFRTKYLKSSVN